MVYMNYLVFFLTLEPIDILLEAQCLIPEHGVILLSLCSPLLEFLAPRIDLYNLRFKSVCVVVSLTIYLLLDALVLGVVLPDDLLQLLKRELAHRVQAEVHRLLLRLLRLLLFRLGGFLHWLELGEVVLLEVGVRRVAAALVVDHLV